MNIFSAAGFTNLGYTLHARGFTPINTDLTGKTAVVTGATGGLGLETARQLAGLGASVVIIARNPEKLDRARSEITGDVTKMQADLGVIEEVKGVARQLSESERIDILVNNVGVLFPERGDTTEGVEQTLATNLAGHFALTNLLIPVLSASAPARVVNVSSGGMYLARISPGNLQSDRGEYSGSAAYARTKRGQVILTEMWAQRLESRGVTVNSMHPGWVKTEGVKNSLPGFNRVMKPLLRDVRQGADTIVWLAASDEAADQTGLFWFDREPAETHVRTSTMETPQQRARLWKELVELTGTDYPEADR